MSTAPPAGLLLSHTEIKAAIASGAAGHFKGIFEAIVAAGSVLMVVPPGVSLDCARAFFEGRSWVLIVSDDLEKSVGPAGFTSPVLCQLAERATHAAVYSGAADLRIYEMFGVVARTGARLLVIETQLRHHADWCDWCGRFAPDTPLLQIQPPPEGHA
jgi:hypothetical protein